MSGRAQKQLEQFIGRTLQAGVMLAALLGLVGGALYLAQHGGAQPDYRTFRGEESSLRSPGAIIVAAAKGDAKAFIMLGLLVLIATPIVRVLLSVGLFALERDGVYVAITLMVLAVLAWSLLGGH